VEHSEVTTEKIADISCWFWLKCRKCCETFWAESICVDWIL